MNLWLDDPHTPWVPDATGRQGRSTPENLQAVMAETDRQIGRLLDGLKELGIERDTLVIFTSDNGALPTFGGLRSAGLRGSKLSLYEGGVRVPSSPAGRGHVAAGRVDTSTVLSAVDLFPTLCSSPGRTCPRDMRPDGEDRSAACAQADAAPVRGRCSGSTAATTSSSPIRPGTRTAPRTWRCATATGSCWSTPTALARRAVRPRGRPEGVEEPCRGPVRTSCSELTNLAIDWRGALAGTNERYIVDGSRPVAAWSAKRWR